ncbi:uncharacterized protein LOC125582248 [Brassica napus]|uniref:uncharacterized protein LOC125582248 n=1 Tax=Brassica napus TaxID=3708 RepID=UPI0020784C63|nr:uncharacterized protein LOC125582248 [Brassica napus]
MIFTYSNAHCCIALSSILHKYELASGKKINPEKSSITFSSKTPPEVKNQVKTLLGIDKEGGVGKYMGLPEHFGRKKRDLFASIVDKIKQRSISWTTSFLSTAGKATMLQAVLSSVPTFAMSLCGLGFRDIILFNQALLAKIAWRLIRKPDCLLARVLLGKYCHKSSFLKVNHGSSSHGWKGILWGRDLPLNHLGKSIGNGESTRVWQDPWIPSAPSPTPYGPIQEKDQDLMVSDLLTRETKEWNALLINERLPELLHHIQLIKPSLLGAPDAYVWKADSSSSYSVKSGYNSLHYPCSRPTVPLSRLLTEPQKDPNNNNAAATVAQDNNSGDFDWKKNVWNIPSSPKLKMFLWKAAQDSLPTGANLSRRGISSNVNCVHCNCQETTLHALFNCRFAQEVWKSGPWESYMDHNTLNSFRGLLVSSQRKKNLPPYGVSINLLPWICWTYSPQETFNKAILLAREWEHAQKPKPARGPATIAAPPLPTETSSAIRCNTDAAWKPDSTTAGISWIFTAPSTVEVNRGSKIQMHVSSPLLAEALAIREALQQAISLKLTHIWVRSDSQVLVRAIDRNRSSSELHGVLSDVTGLTSSFIFCFFSFISRNSNGPADALAKACLANFVSSGF